MACGAMTAAGNPCGNPPPKGRKYCIWHDPDRKAEADRLRKQGGDIRKAQRTKVVAAEELPDPPETPEAVEEALRWAGAAIASGRLDPQSGGAYVRSLEVLHRSQLARLGLKERIKELEARVKELVAG